MRNGVVFLLAALLVLAALPLAAQQDQANVSRAFWVKPKPGMAQEFEKAAKAHLDWHRQQKDTWTWTTLQFETGERLGQFIVVTQGHRWEEFDARAEFDKADVENWAATVGPHVESTSSVFSVARLDVSRPLADPTPPAMTLAIYFHVKPGTDADFNYCMRKFHEAIGKTNWPGNYTWLQRVAGTDVPQYVLVLPRKNWAAFKPGEKRFDQMLEEAFGAQEARELLEKFGATVRYETAEILRHRPDLSYQAPAAAGR